MEKIMKLTMESNLNITTISGKMLVIEDIRRNFIGRGAAGIIYKAKYDDSRYEVAVKQLIDTRETNIMNESEIRINKYIQGIKNCKFINVLLDCAVIENDCFLIFEYHPYTIQQKILETPEVMRKNSRFYLLQIIIAVKFLHENNILHCDLTSANVLMTHNHLIKIIDFSHSKIVSNVGKCVEGCGNDCFMPPEYFPEKKFVSGATDIWSVGCIYLHMKFSKIPFMMLKNAKEGQSELIKKSLQVYMMSDYLINVERMLLFENLLAFKKSKRNILGALNSFFFQYLKEDEFFKKPYINNESLGEFLSYYTNNNIIKEEHCGDISNSDFYMRTYFDARNEYTVQVYSNKHQVICNYELVNDEIKNANNKKEFFDIENRGLIAPCFSDYFKSGETIYAEQYPKFNEFYRKNEQIANNRIFFFIEQILNILLLINNYGLLQIIVSENIFDFLEIKECTYLKFKLWSICNNITCVDNYYYNKKTYNNGQFSNFIKDLVSINVMAFKNKEDILIINKIIKLLNSDKNTDGECLELIRNYMNKSESKMKRNGNGTNFCAINSERFFLQNFYENKIKKDKIGGIFVNGEVKEIVNISPFINFNPYCEDEYELYKPLSIICCDKYIIQSLSFLKNIVAGYDMIKNNYMHSLKRFENFNKSEIIFFAPVYPFLSLRYFMIFHKKLLLINIDAIVLLIIKNLLCLAEKKLFFDYFTPDDIFISTQNLEIQLFAPHKLFSNSNNGKVLSNVFAAHNTSKNHYLKPGNNRCNTLNMSYSIAMMVVFIFGGGKINGKLLTIFGINKFEHKFKEKLQRFGDNFPMLFDYNYITSLLQEDINLNKLFEKTNELFNQKRKK